MGRGETHLRAAPALRRKASPKEERGDDAAETLRASTSHRKPILTLMPASLRKSKSKRKGAVEAVALVQAVGCEWRRAFKPTKLTHAPETSALGQAGSESTGNDCAALKEQLLSANG